MLNANAVLAATAGEYGNQVANNETENTESEDSKDTVEIEKKLVQCDEHWTIFQYDDENGDPINFDVLYDGKTPEELADEGIKIQYRPVSNSIDGIRGYYWTDFGDEISDLPASIFYSMLMEFRVITSDESSILSLSDTFALYDAQSPYIMSMDPYFYNDYALDDKQNVFTVTLKYNEHVNMDNEAYISITHNRDSLPLTEYSASNLSIENKTSTHTIEGKEYTIDYSIVTFDVKLPSLIFIEDSSQVDDEYYENIWFFFNINGIIGSTTKSQVQGFMISTWITFRYVEPIVDVESIEISGEKTSLAAGESTQLTATISPSNATVQTVSWEVGDDDYASVDENGVVTAKSAGIGKEVTIFAVADDESGVYGSYTITITAPTTEETATTETTTELPVTTETMETTTELPMTTETTESTEATTELPATTESTETVTPMPASKGTLLTDEKNKCKVTVTSSDEKNPTVVYQKSTNPNAKTIKIPNTITMDGVTYKVTGIADNALANNKKITKVTIGSNVVSIGKNAFKNCTKLKTVEIKSTILKKIGANAFSGSKKLTKITLKTSQLTKDSVGKNALKGTSKKLVIKAPKQMVKKYKSYFKNKGNKTVTVKK